jgi:hypothetical protein
MKRCLLEALSNHNAVYAAKEKLKQSVSFSSEELQDKITENPTLFICSKLLQHYSNLNLFPREISPKAETLVFFLEKLKQQFGNFI